MAGSQLLWNLLPGAKDGRYNTNLKRHTYFRIAALLWKDTLSMFAYYVMMNYLTNVWNLSITRAAGLLNITKAIIAALIIVFFVFVDVFVGGYYMLVLSNIAQSIAWVLFSLSTPTFFGPCSEYKDECIGHIQKVLFFTALPLMVVGTASQTASFKSFFQLHLISPARKALQANNQAQDPAQPKHTPGEEEARPDNKESKVGFFSDNHVEAQTEGQALDPALRKLLISILLNSMISLLALIGASIVLPYIIKPWSIRFGIPAICCTIATVFFVTGSYDKGKPKESAITTALRVFVAATTKDFQIGNYEQYYNGNDTQEPSNENDTQEPSRLRWLNKAALKFPDQALSKSWTLCSVSEVKNTKICIRVVPMLLTFIVPGVLLSLETTYFLEQANHMDPKLGSIEIHVQTFLLLRTSIIIICQIPDSLLMRTRIPARYHVPAKIVTGMILSVLCCITAAIVETQRLRVIKTHGLEDKPNERIPMSVVYLFPQFLLLAAVEGILLSAFNNLIWDHLPENSDSHAAAEAFDLMNQSIFYIINFVFGLGSMANVLWVYVVGKMSEINEKPNWFQHTSNKSRLDRYYWTLAGLSAVNLVIYVIVASFYNLRESPFGKSINWRMRRLGF